MVQTIWWHSRIGVRIKYTELINRKFGVQEQFSG